MSSFVDAKDTGLCVQLDKESRIQWSRECTVGYDAHGEAELARPGSAEIRDREVEAYLRRGDKGKGFQEQEGGAGVTSWFPKKGVALAGGGYRPTARLQWA